jgi:predicted protein tyrosine phosphatase
MRRVFYPPQLVIRRRSLSEFIIPERWLFVCSMNFQRSPTAEYVARKAGFWADSCGTDDSAGKQLNWDRTNWADVIVCMEEKHRVRVRRITGDSKRVFNWDVRDDFDYMAPKLITLLEGRLEETKKILDQWDAEAEVAASEREATRRGGAPPLYRLDE